MEISIDLLLEELNTKELLTQRNVSDLRKYISARFPEHSQLSKATIFANAVNKIITDRTSVINETYRDEIIKNLFKETVNKPTFAINAKDIFQACVKSEFHEDIFIDEISQWCGNILGKPYSKDTIRNFTVELMNERRKIHTGEVNDLVGPPVIDVLEVKNQYIKSEERTVNQTESQNLTELTINALQSSEETATSDVHIISQGDILSTYETSTTQQPPDYHKLKGTYTTILIGAVAFVFFFVFSYILSDKPINNNDTLPLDNHKVDLSSSSDKFLADTDKSDFINMDKEIVSRFGPNSELPENINKFKEKLHMTATAYDLSFESCNKTREHPEYGITYTGTRAEFGRTVAVDPTIIPLGSRMYILFPEEYNELNGVYVAEDTGSLIKGDIIDIFFGEDKPGETTVNKAAMKFGVRKVTVYILE